MRCQKVFKAGVNAYHADIITLPAYEMINLFLLNATKTFQADKFIFFKAQY